MAKGRTNVTATELAKQSNGHEIMSAVQLKDSEVAKIKLPSTFHELKILSTELSPLNVKDLADVKTYEVIKAIDLKVVKLRTGLDTIHKNVKAPYLEITKAIDAAKNEMLSEITNLETISKAKRKVWEDLAAAEEARQAQIIIDRTNARLERLTALGATLHIDDVTNMSDSLFNEHIDLLTRQAEEKRIADELAQAEIAAEKAAADKLAAEAAEKLAADQEILRKEQERISKEAQDIKTAKLEMIVSKATAIGYTAAGGNKLEYKGRYTYVDLTLPIETTMTQLTGYADQVKTALINEAKLKDPAVLVVNELKEIEKQVLALNLNYSIPMTQANSIKISNEAKAKLLALKNEITVLVQINITSPK